ncbi:MAG: hypothetical protein IKC43_01740 [Clostridia bacterium]|nr:hypothetical protein [Clostridia bacterium]
MRLRRPPWLAARERRHFRGGRLACLCVPLLASLIACPFPFSLASLARWLSAWVAARRVHGGGTSAPKA